MGRGSAKVAAVTRSGADETVITARSPTDSPAATTVSTSSARATMAARAAMARAMRGRCPPRPCREPAGRRPPAETRARAPAARRRRPPTAGRRQVDPIGGERGASGAEPRQVAHPRQQLHDPFAGLLGLHAALHAGSPSACPRAPAAASSRSRRSPWPAIGARGRRARAGQATEARNRTCRVRIVKPSPSRTRDSCRPAARVATCRPRAGVASATVVRPDSSGRTTSRSAAVFAGAPGMPAGGSVLCPVSPWDPSSC